jgi:hypothetical protein
LFARYAARKEIPHLERLNKAPLAHRRPNCGMRNAANVLGRRAVPAAVTPAALEVVVVIECVPPPGTPARRKTAMRTIPLIAASLFGCRPERRRR